MITKNKLDNSFGTVGATAGRFLFIAGLLLTAWHLSALILVLLGAFVGFTFSCTYIDLHEKRFKFSNNLFGFIPTGSWMQIEPSMKIRIKESNLTYRSFSQGNRPLDLMQNDVRLVLFDANNREISVLRKTANLIEARIELALLCDRLGLSAI